MNSSKTLIVVRASPRKDLRSGGDIYFKTNGGCNEPLVSRLATLPLKQPEFNPFRDVAVLERMAIGKFGVGGIRQFPPL